MPTDLPDGKHRATEVVKECFEHEVRVQAVLAGLAFLHEINLYFDRPTARHEPTMSQSRLPNELGIGDVERSDALKWLLQGQSCPLPLRSAEADDSIGLP